MEANLRAGEVATGLECVPSLNNLVLEQLECVLNLIENSGDGALIQRLIDGINRIDDSGLKVIIETEHAPLNLRSAAVTELQDRDGGVWDQFEETALNIYTEMGDAVQIGSILMEMKKIML